MEIATDDCRTKLSHIFESTLINSRMKSRYFISVLSCLLCMSTLSAQQTLQGALTWLPPVDPDTLTASGWLEQVSLRDEKTATWKNTDGKIRIEYADRPIHFKDEDGKWQRIIPSLRETTDGWNASAQPHPISIDRHGVITMNAGSSVSFVSGKNISINGTEIHPQQEYTNYNVLIAKDVIPHVDREIMAYENSVKTQYRLHQSPSTQNASFVTKEELLLPSGAMISPDREHGQQTENGWKGRLLILDHSGHEIGSIGALLCYDEDNDYTIGVYTWNENKATGLVELTANVSSAWLMDESRNYPIVIDPLIVGTLSEWGTEYMPSCYNPEFHVDSLLITVPGQITVTGFYVTTSFYADPLSGVGTVMGDGQMYFSTSCDTSGIFTAQPPYDVLPGTAYLLNFDFRDPLMCCFEPSCSETSFYFRMHLGRTYPEGDCNLTYVYYTPFSQWPFMAYVEGYTVETWGPGWTVEPFPICSDECVTDAIVRVRFGVPPYTIEHPWMTQQVIAETPTPCDLESKMIELPLNVPNCPLYCPGFFSLDVPPPTVTDACGNVATGLVLDILNVKPTPTISIPEIDLCSNEPADIILVSCDEEAEIEWTLNGEVNSGNIYISQENTGTEVITYEYDCWATAHGCESDTLNFDIDIHPSPSIDFAIYTDPGNVNNPMNFVSESIVNGSDIATWEWQFNGEGGYSDSAVIITPIYPGEYSVCLTVTTEVGCENSLCKIFNVLPVHVSAPNIFTPNGDGSNDFLHFNYLEFVPDNHLTVYNRWGNIIYETDRYQNSWSADGISDGTYYFILELNGQESLSGNVQILR